MIILVQEQKQDIGLVENGNLVVTGNSQSIVSTDTAITDHYIILNNGVTSPNPLGANIIVDRGSSPNVSIAWDEVKSAWECPIYSRRFLHQR